MKIIIIFLSSLKKYGFKLLSLILIFEILNIYKFNIYEYIFVPSKKKKDEGYVPTPHYFLSLLKKFFYKKDATFIEFGCGRGRVVKFVNNYNNFKKIVGIENNIKLKNDLEKIKNNKINFYFEDCINKKFIKKLSKKYQNKKTILYFYYPFSSLMIKNIIDIFLNQQKNDFRVILIGVNVNIKTQLNFLMNKSQVNPIFYVYDFKYKKNII